MISKIYDDKETVIITTKNTSEKNILIDLTGVSKGCSYELKRKYGASSSSKIVKKLKIYKRVRIYQLSCNQNIIIN